MSQPTKGMVAGKPIQTGTQTKEWDEGFARTFGERKPARGRFVYTEGGKPLEAPVHVDEAWQQPDSGPSLRSEEEVYGHCTATDGTNLSTKGRHRQYMKDNNLSLAGDFTNHWAQEEKRRAAELTGQSPQRRKEIKETVGKAFHESRRRKP